ncbi:hypothetical protein QTO34_001246, partial [Cnephaeus nilssonii]
MIYYLLDPENPTKSCKSKSSNFRVHFKNTYETAQDVTLQKQCVPFIIIMVELVGVPRPNNAARHQVGHPKKSAEFLLYILKNAEINADLKGLDVYSLIIEHIQVNKTPKMWHRTYRAHEQINPNMSSPCHIKMILLKKNRLFLNQKKRLHRRKTFPEETEETKILWPWREFSF